ncbi:MAG: AAA family ATPase [Mycoplasmataceae bacterium]|nr:AAA family ATPase [Mycoplasmataceae bacterium]
MKLYRKVYLFLEEWNKNIEKKTLIVSGNRQIGKTKCIQDFCYSKYKKVIYIDFINEPEYIEAFKGSLSTKEILRKINLINDDFIYNENTIIFFDEIQNCPNAIISLKYFTIDKIDVICSGSFLGTSYNCISSFPVGYVELYQMHSLDFEEFIINCGIKQNIIEEVKQNYIQKTCVDNIVHDKLMNLIKQYICVGGMPEVVNSFIEKNNMSLVYKIQKNIIDGYIADIAKYADNSEKNKARVLYESLPRHLAKEYKKFQYKLIEKNGNSRKYLSSLQWIKDANLVQICYNISLLQKPLKGFCTDETFKVYYSDIGLLCCNLGNKIQNDILFGNLQIFKGAIYENLFADFLIKKNIPLYYYTKNSGVSEIDFVCENDEGIVLYEVKSENGKAKSLVFEGEKNNIKQLFKIISGNVGKNNKFVSLPWYMCMFI